MGEIIDNWRDRGVSEKDILHKMIDMTIVEEEEIIYSELIRYVLDKYHK